MRHVIDSWVDRDDEVFEQVIDVLPWPEKDCILLGAQSHPHEGASLRLDKEQVEELIESLKKAIEPL